MDIRVRLELSSRRPRTPTSTTPSRGMPRSGRFTSSRKAVPGEDPPRAIIVTVTPAG